MHSRVILFLRREASDAAVRNKDRLRAISAADIYYDARKIHFSVLCRSTQREPFLKLCNFKKFVHFVKFVMISSLGDCCHVDNYVTCIFLVRNSFLLHVVVGVSQKACFLFSLKKIYCRGWMRKHIASMDVTTTKLKHVLTSPKT